MRLACDGFQGSLYKLGARDGKGEVRRGERQKPKVKAESRAEQTEEPEGKEEDLGGQREEP